MAQQEYNFKTEIKKLRLRGLKRRNPNSVSGALTETNGWGDGGVVKEVGRVHMRQWWSWGSALANASGRRGFGPKPETERRWLSCARAIGNVSGG
jgi:hypothetical protein